MSDKKEREEFLKRFGEYLYKIRTEKDISLGELSRRTFIDKPNITRIEKGRMNPSIYVLRKLCKGLEIELKDFLKEFED